MEEQSYTSTHPLGHTGPVTGSLYLYLLYSKTMLTGTCQTDLSGATWIHPKYTLLHSTSTVTVLLYVLSPDDRPQHIRTDRKVAIAWKRYVLVPHSDKWKHSGNSEIFLGFLKHESSLFRDRQMCEWARQSCYQRHRSCSLLPSYAATYVRLITYQLLRLARGEHKVTHVLWTIEGSTHSERDASTLIALNRE